MWFPSIHLATAFFFLVCLVQEETLYPRETGSAKTPSLITTKNPKVQRWVRNIEGRPRHSFWLHTSTDRFYPDFVCELTNGRFLVVEYKGFDRWSDDDSREKRAIGQVWEEKSAEQCLFIMPKGPDWNAILAKLG